MVVQHASQEPALAHAVLGIAAKTMKKLQCPLRFDDAPDADFHKVAAINHVNRKLQYKNSATEISTLMTVSVLLGYEVFCLFLASPVSIKNLLSLSFAVLSVKLHYEWIEATDHQL